MITDNNYVLFYAFLEAFLFLSSSMKNNFRKLIKLYKISINKLWRLGYDKIFEVKNWLQVDCVIKSEFNYYVT